MRLAYQAVHDCDATVLAQRDSCAARCFRATVVLRWRGERGGDGEGEAVSRNWDFLLRVGLAGLAVAALLLFFLLLGRTPLDQLAAGSLTDWEAVLALGAAAVAFLLLVLVDAARRPGQYRATLRGNLIWLPALAAVLSTALYLADIQGRGFWQQNALPLGSVLAALIWLGYPMIDRPFASAAAANNGSYLALRSRIDRLKSDANRLRATSRAGERAANATVESVLAEASELEGWLARDGEAWVSGTGYIEAWSRVQEADVELLAQRDRATLVSTGLYDMLRLRGSNIKDREALLAGLRLAVREIDPGADPYVNGLEILRPAGADGWSPQQRLWLVSQETVLQRALGTVSVRETTITEDTLLPETVDSDGPEDETVLEEEEAAGEGAGDEGERPAVTTRTVTREAPPTPAPAALARSRALLCGIHGIINEYRNDLWAEPRSRSESAAADDLRGRAAGIPGPWPRPLAARHGRTTGERLAALPGGSPGRAPPAALRGLSAGRRRG